MTDADGAEHALCTSNCNALFDDLQSLKDKEAFIQILGLATADPALQGAASSLDIDALVARGSAGTRAVAQFLKLPGDERASLLGETPGWVETTLLQGTHEGQGWALRETAGRGRFTDRVLRWHPGGGRHGTDR